MTAIASLRPSSAAPWVHALALFEAPAVHHPSLVPEALDRTLAEVLSSAPAVSTSHRFTPHGLSVALLSSAVRVFLHTWPERALVTVDVQAEEEAEALRILRELSQRLEWRLVETEARVRSCDGGQGPRQGSTEAA